jgi:phosphoribosylformimino-5-aminoimidazole carboxamide ribotide isomerase
VGGGIRSLEAAREILDLGARRVILGSTLVRHGSIDLEFAEAIADAVGLHRLVFAIDAKGGNVAIRGWREITAIAPLEMIRALQSWCDAFLYTHIDTEGMMQGIPIATVRALREATTKQLIVAGGISSNDEIELLHASGVDAVVGMALYLGKLDLDRVQR